jgi:DNA-binding MltR family transcriptional regulator
LATFDGLSDSSRYDDRSVAIVAGTLLEHALESAVSSYFVDVGEAEIRKLFEGDGEREGAIGSFHAKASIAYALGVFGPQTRSDLSLIRRIRNVFAHSAAIVSFTTESVTGACNFSYINRMLWGGFAGPEPKTAREKFEKTTFHYSLLLSSYENAREKGITISAKHLAYRTRMLC